MSSIDKISLKDKLKICCYALFYGDVYLKRYCQQRKICQQREGEMKACIRPKTYPKVPKDARTPTYTDYFDDEASYRKFWNKYDKTSENGGC